MKLLLEVKNIRPCAGGHSCNLSANGRKVAFIAPDILEWTSHSKMVDVLEAFALQFGLKKAGDVQPKILKDGWEREVPDYKIGDLNAEQVEAELLRWINYHIQAYEIVKRCKNVLIAIDKDGSLVEFNCSQQTIRSAYLKNILSISDYTMLNGKSYDEVLSLILPKIKS